MGPIERELRNGWPTWYWVSSEASRRCWHVLRGAALNLGHQGLNGAEDDRAMHDVFSEAIEAAEALGL